MTCKNKVATEYGYVTCGTLCGGTFRCCEECESAEFVQETSP